ncbi:MAG: hypothetical protein M5R42_16590, partial [Rhodocyclaceae bacterium]|nr:hypothetical protein [Rhodocyclaceae bacterium]
MNEIDLVRLNFNPQSLWALNFIIGLVMFGVALDLKVSDFKAVLTTPKPVLIGLAGQFLLLPAFTFLLVLAIKPAPEHRAGHDAGGGLPGRQHLQLPGLLRQGQRGAVDFHDGGVDRRGDRDDAVQPVAVGRAASRGERNSAAGGARPAGNAAGGVPPARPADGTGHDSPPPLSALRGTRPEADGNSFRLGVFGLFVIGALAANWRYFIDFVGFVVFAV